MQLSWLLESPLPASPRPRKTDRCSSSCTLERVRFTPKADVTLLKGISRLSLLGFFHTFPEHTVKASINILSAIVFVGPARSDYTENQDTDILSLFCLAQETFDLCLEHLLPCLSPCFTSYIPLSIPHFRNYSQFPQDQPAHSHCRQSFGHCSLLDNCRQMLRALSCHTGTIPAGT